MRKLAAILMISAVSFFAASSPVGAQPGNRTQDKGVAGNVDGPQKARLVVQLGHSSFIVRVAVSPDGTQILTGSNDRTARLWDARTGKEIHSFEANAGWVSAMAFSSDGTRICTGHLSKKAIVWDAKTGKQLQVFDHDGLFGEVTAVAFSPDDRWIATASEGKLRLWNVTSLESRLLQSAKERNDLVRTVAFSPDGKSLVTGGKDGHARLWDVQTGKEIRAFQRTGTEVPAVAFTPDGKGVLAVGYDKKGTLHLWDVNTAKVLKVFPHACWCLAFSRDGRTLATGDGDSTVRVWSTDTWQELRQFRVRGLGVYSMALAPDSGWLVTASALDDGSWSGGVARLWDVQTGKELRAFEGHSQKVWALALSPDGNLLATGNDDGTGQLWDLSAGRLLRSLKGHPDHQLTAAVFATDSKTLLTGGQDGTARLWDVHTGKELRAFSKHQSWVSVSLSRDGKYAATASLDGLARLWDLRTGKELRTFQGGAKKRDRTVVTFSPDGTELLTVTADHMILWATETGEMLRAFAKERTHMFDMPVFTADGRAIWASAGLETALWNTKTGEKLETLPFRVDGPVAVSPNGEWLLTGGRFGDLRLWERKTGREILKFQGLIHDISVVAFSHDGRRAISLAHDHTIRFWDCQTGKELCRLVSFKDGTWAVVDADGRFDASNSGDVEGLHWVAGNEPIALSQLKELYYDPGLLAKHMGFAKKPLLKVDALREVTLFPAVAAKTTKDNKLALHLTNQGGGIGKVQVFVNGRQLHADARGPKTDPKAEKVELPPVDLDSVAIKPGEVNKIRIVTWNSQGYLSSRGVEIPWLAPGRKNEQQPELYIIAAGISEYGKEELKLSFAAKDAADMAGALALAGKRLWGADKVHVRLLCDTKHPSAIAPTRENLEKAFVDFRKARPSDILVVYLAGHGIAMNEDNQQIYCYLTSEARTTDTDAFRNPAVRKQYSITSIELTDWLNKIPANKQALVLDTCAAGAAKSKLMEHRELSAEQIRAIDRMRDRTGFQVLMGCAADKVSYESHRYAQGHLTHALLKGMRGAKLQDDEFVDVSLLFQYAADEVPQMAGFIGGIQKPLVLAPHGTSFLVGQLNKDDKKLIPLTTARPQILQPKLSNPDAIDDDLGLEPLLRKRLASECYLSGRGQNKQPQAVYVAADELPGAIRTNGKYTVTGEKVVVTLVLRRDGKELARLTIEGRRDDTSGLANRMATAIIAQADKLETP